MANGNEWRSADMMLQAGIACRCCQAHEGLGCAASDSHSIEGGEKRSIAFREVPHFKRFQSDILMSESFCETRDMLATIGAIELAEREKGKKRPAYWQTKKPRDGT